MSKKHKSIVKTTEKTLYGPASDRLSSHIYGIIIDSPLKYKMCDPDKHDFGIDGVHCNVYCKNCFVSKEELEKGVENV